MGLVNRLLDFVLTVRVSHIALLYAVVISMAGHIDTGYHYLLLGVVIMIWERLGVILEELRK